MKKLFTNDNFFEKVSILGFICLILYSGYHIIPGSAAFSLSAVFTGVFTGACVLTIYISYYRHSKNVMKGIMGALLAAMVLGAFNRVMAKAGGGVAFNLAAFVLNLILFINHFIINAEHHSRRTNIVVNQVVVLLNVLVTVAFCVVQIIGAEGAMEICAAVLSCIGFVCSLVCVVCVESRLDAYRIDREAAGWTEEKGYPEGYVHQYEKES